MIKNERQDRILDIIQQRQYATVEELAEELYVSLPTVRRDLAELAAKNYIRRNHGGACRLEDYSQLTPFRFRSAFMENKKKAVCKAAAERIRDGDCIFIDNSSSARHVAEYLVGRNGLTVVTSSLGVLLTLLESGISVYGTGGFLRDSSYGFTGHFAEQLLESFRFDIMFFSTSGITAAGEIVDVSGDELPLLRTAIRRSERVAYLCFQEKFGVTAPYVTATVDQVDYVITDALPDGYFVPPEKLILP